MNVHSELGIMTEGLNKTALNQIASHQRKLGLKFRLKGLGYERCAELSWIIENLRHRFNEPLRYLDIGTGESPLPSFLAIHTEWDITCLDKCPWVQKQTHFYERTRLEPRPGRHISVIEADLLQEPLPDESLDVITCISVIEHFEGASDTAAIKAIARLLRPGGSLVLTTLINESFFAEFYVKKTVYGTEFKDSPVFYQRHYDVESIDRRLIQPSGLIERERVYFGDYGFQCFERIVQLPKPLRALYAWNMPVLARRCLSYRTYPVSRKDMRMNTASGIILVLDKPASIRA